MLMSKNKFTVSSIINIDSSFRNKNPKHIFKANNKFLPNNPINFTKGSSIITINYPNHGLTQGTNIIIQNVEGSTKILSDSFYLINNFRYLVILIDHKIPVDYKTYTDELFINIELIGEQIENNIINNIPFNYLIGFKKCLIANDIQTTYLKTFTNLANEILDNINISEKCLFIELPYQYINQTDNYIKINQTFKITNQHIAGIPLGYLNANYPINNINYQNSYQVYSVIDNNSFQINLNNQAFAEISGGEKNVQIMEIVNTITGYPDADYYVINLKKSFNNVVGIELISTEFPYVDIAIKKNQNDKLYWKNIEDGNVIYSVQIDEGFYTANNLLNKILEYINNVPRNGFTQTNLLYNYFDINLEANIQKVIFKPYNLTKLPNSLSVRKETINNANYYILNVGHPNNIVDINDIITISGSDNVTVKLEQDGTAAIYSIDPSYINKDHIIYAVNLENQTYDIILGKETEIKFINISTEAYGGENIKVKSKTKVCFLFNKSDTLGNVLGFRNVGDKNSITNFSSEISNHDTYINSNTLDVVGNPYNYTGGFLNLSGKYNYMLMYLNDIEYIYSNNNLPSAFAKIAFSGNPGDVLFNTYVPYPINVYSKNFPISNLTDLTIKFIYPDGTKVNFRNIDHSFTLRITEEKVQNSNTYLNSQNISVFDEFKNAKLL